MQSREWTVTVTLNGGDEVTVYVQLPNNVAYSAQATAACEEAMSDCRSNGMQPASAVVDWQVMAEAEMERTDASHNLIDTIMGTVEYECGHGHVWRELDRLINNHSEEAGYKGDY